MNPDREAMISGSRSARPHDITSPRRNNNNRISKPSRQNKPGPPTKGNKFLTQEEQSRKFIADEDKFVLRQSKKKADIRVREGRGNPVDYLCFNLRWIDADRDVFDDNDKDVDIDVSLPDKIVEDLDETRLKELEGEIASYITLESDSINKEYWRALQSLCKERLRKLRPHDDGARTVGSVAADVDKILAPKTLPQLEALEKQIKKKLDSDEDIDMDYWEQLLKSLIVWKARANLGKTTEAILEAKQSVWRKMHPDGGATILEEQPQISNGKGPMEADDDEPKVAPKLPSWATADDKAQAPGTERFSTGQQDFTQATKALYEREVARGINDNEEIFTAEEATPSAPQPQWAGQYRPRKPQYFNRVQMGYEWNKYNQTHYDHDNPPPKVVQGYKFNVFYPDLIDKSKAPTFKIIREGGRRRGESTAAAGEQDTCLIRFVAGPPYEDVAFRIVDKEWDYSAKRDRGFRSSFDKGILQLHFQFQKIYYRK